MLSNDLNTIEVKAPYFFAATVAPFTLIGILAILVVRFGWPGLIVFIVILLFVPLQAFVGKINGETLTKANVNKDKRVKICSEII